MSLFGSTYGPLGGQAAAAEVQGRLKGDAYMEQKKDMALNRKLKQEKWKIQSELEKAKVWDAYTKMSMWNDQIQKTGALGQNTPETMEMISQKMNALTSEMNKSNGRTLQSMINQFLGSPKPAEDLEAIKNTLKDNPSLAKNFGPNFDPNTMRMLNPNDERDVSNMMSHLTKVDPTYQHQTQENQKKLAQTAIKSGNYFEANGHVQDASALAMMTGAATKMTATQKEVYEKKQKEGVRNTRAPEQQYASYTSKVEPKTGTADTEQGGGANTQSSDQSFLDKTAQVEGTTDEQARKYGYASGYDVPIAYGRYGKPPKPLTEMTLGEIYDYQQQIKRHPDNKNPRAGNKPSSAVGRYQFVEGTLKEYADKLGFDENTKFTPAVQDALALALYKDRGTSPWEGYARAGYTSPQYASYKSGVSPQYGGASAMDMPYGSADGITKDEVIRNFLGIQDSRPALQRNLDYIARKLGPNATLGDVASSYDAIMTAGRKHLGSGTGSLNDEMKDIQGFTLHAQDMVQRGVWTPEEAQAKVDEFTEKRWDASLVGVGGNLKGETGNKKFENVSLFRNIKNPNQQDRRIAAINEGYLPNLSQTETDYLSQGVDLTKRAYDIANFIKQNPDRFLKGGVEPLMQWIGVRSPDTVQKLGAFIDTLKGRKDVTAKEIEDKIEATVGLNTRLGRFVSDYLKLQSGTAVGAEEAKRLIGGVLSSLETQDPKYAAQALNAFGEDLRGTIDRRLTTLGDRGYTATAWNYRDRLNEINSPDLKQAEVAKNSYTKPQKPSHTQTAQKQISQEGLVKFNSLSPRQQDALLAAPDGEEVIYKGKKYIWNRRTKMLESQGGN